MAEVESLDSILQEHIPAEKLEVVQRLLYGEPTKYSILPFWDLNLFRKLTLPQSALEDAAKGNFELQGFSFPCPAEQVGLLPLNY